MPLGMKSEGDKSITNPSLIDFLTVKDELASKPDNPLNCMILEWQT